MIPAQIFSSKHQPNPTQSKSGPTERTNNQPTKSTNPITPTQIQYKMSIPTTLLTAIIAASTSPPPSAAGSDFNLSILGRSSDSGSIEVVKMENMNDGAGAGAAAAGDAGVAANDTDTDQNTNIYKGTYPGSVCSPPLPSSLLSIYLSPTQLLFFFLSPTKFTPCTVNSLFPSSPPPPFSSRPLLPFLFLTIHPPY